MENVITWITTHGAEALAVLAGLLLFIAKVTPSPKDDAVVAKILNFFNLLPISAKNKLEGK